MRKKLLALLLCLILALNLSPAALATDQKVRETDFFTDQEHADVDFADMEYVHIDIQPMKDELTAIRGLLTDTANADKAVERFSAVVDQYLELSTMSTIATIHHSQNVMDDEAAEELEYCYAASTEISDAISQFARDALRSPCGNIFKKEMSEEDVEYYLSYTDMSDEEKALYQQETALVNKYYQAAASITVEYNGEEWTSNDAYFAMAAGEMDRATYNTIDAAYAKKENEVLGPIYLEMIPVRKQIAAFNGYDTYTRYAYEVIYQRDYAPEDIQAFHKAVKSAGFYQIGSDILKLARAGLNPDVYYNDYTSDETIDLVGSYIGQMSSEMAEAYTYMQKHGLYDVKTADYKDGTGYTTLLLSYSAPFFFSTPQGYFGDFTTIIHEFGHYNQYYWVESNLESPAKSQDIAEVHSQALELLFTHWYDDIIGDSAQFGRDFLMQNLITSICDGALHDEFQQYVYAASGELTLEDLNQKYFQLCKEYGMANADTPSTEMYRWVEIPHTFTSPCYYISYGVSAVGAFAFWLKAQQGEYFDAVDDYLRFCALPCEMQFQESFQEMDMDNPLDPEYLAELASTLRTVLKLEERTATELPPSDLTGTEWFYPAAYALYSAGVIEKDENGLVHPRAQAVWNDAAALAERLTSNRPEVENGDAPITRVEFARLLVEELDLDEAASPFSDTSDGAVGALAEMGAITGYADGTFHPNQNMTRAEMWVTVYRVLMSAVESLLTSVAA